MPDLLTLLIPGHMDQLALSGGREFAIRTGGSVGTASDSEAALELAQKNAETYNADHGTALEPPTHTCDGTLSYAQIAAKYGITVEDLFRWNNWKSDAATVAQYKDHIPTSGVLMVGDPMAPGAWLTPMPRDTDDATAKRNSPEEAVRRAEAIYTGEVTRILHAEIERQENPAMVSDDPWANVPVDSPLRAQRDRQLALQFAYETVEKAGGAFASANDRDLPEGWFAGAEAGWPQTIGEAQGLIHEETQRQQKEQLNEDLGCIMGPIYYHLFSPLNHGSGLNLITAWGAGKEILPNKPMTLEKALPGGYTLVKTIKPIGNGIYGHSYGLRPPGTLFGGTIGLTVEQADKLYRELTSPSVYKNTKDKTQPDFVITPRVEGETINDVEYAARCRTPNTKQVADYTADRFLERPDQRVIMVGENHMYPSKEFALETAKSIEAKSGKQVAMTYELDTAWQPVGNAVEAAVPAGSDPASPQVQAKLEAIYEQNKPLINRLVHDRHSRINPTFDRGMSPTERAEYYKKQAMFTLVNVATRASNGISSLFIDIDLPMGEHPEYLYYGMRDPSMAAAINTYLANNPGAIVMYTGGSAHCATSPLTYNMLSIQDQAGVAPFPPRPTTATILASQYGITPFSVRGVGTKSPQHIIEFYERASTPERQREQILQFQANGYNVDANAPDWQQPANTMDLIVRFN